MHKIRCFRTMYTLLFLKDVPVCYFRSRLGHHTTPPPASPRLRHISLCKTINHVHILPNLAPPPPLLPLLLCLAPASRFAYPETYSLICVMAHQLMFNYSEICCIFFFFFFFSHRLIYVLIYCSAYHDAVVRPLDELLTYSL